ncbi:MAG: phenylacetate--CoA ligase family protein [Chloroflexota bacterium]
MTFYDGIARQVMAPAYDLVRGTHTMQCLRELEESQWWPLERILELQSRRLARLVEHAYVRVPHYRRVMDERGIVPSDIRTAADLAALPVLTRSYIQEHGSDLIAEGFPRRRMRVTRTSGSTGHPLRFYSTREDQVDHGYARNIRALEWAGLRLGDRTVGIARPREYGNRQDRYLKDLSRRFKRHISIDVDSLSDRNLPLIVALLSSERVVGLRGYPNAVALLAASIKDSGLPAPEIRSVVTGAGELLGHQRALIREVFGTEPYSKYSSFEVYEIACECGAHAGLHVAAEDVVVEVVDDKGNPVPPGVEGTIVVTNLHNYAMPFIRYELGDNGTLLDGDCPCGRALPRLGSLVGRKNMWLVSRSGRRIAFGTLFLDRLAELGMRQCQVVQETVESVVVRVIPPPTLTQQERVLLPRKVRSMLGPILGDEFALHVEFVERIEPTEAGKHVYVVSKISTV